MTTKLTLSVDKRVIQRAKQYAKNHRKSLSEIVTDYLDFLSTKRGKENEIDREVLEVADDISIDRIPNARDLKLQHLMDKYLHE